LGNAQDVKNSKVLFVGIRFFMQTANKGDAFPIYVLSTSDIKSFHHETPSQYKEFKNVFKKKNVDTLPKHRPYDYTTNLEEGAQPPFMSIYNLSHYEIPTFCEYIDENLEKGFIRHSKSLANAPILFVKKKDEFLQICVDYHGLNRLTINNQYLLPLILGLLDQINSAKVYIKIDLRGAYKLMHIQKGDKWKTKFRTCYGHFEYVVMPFGLSNAPTIFQHPMNDVFCEYLDDFVV
jgi:hypothetical protein